MFSLGKRRRIRYRLSSLLLILTVFCLWLGRTTYLARQQRDAVETIIEAEGNVTYDFEEDAQGARIPNPTPPAPKWLRDAIGDDYFRAPVTVGLSWLTVQVESVGLIL